MEEQKSYTFNELAEKYNVSIKTFRSWIKPIRKELLDMNEDSIKNSRNTLLPSEREITTKDWRIIILSIRFRKTYISPPPFCTSMSPWEFKKRIRNITRNLHRWSGWRIIDIGSIFPPIEPIITPIFPQIPSLKVKEDNYLMFFWHFRKVLKPFIKSGR